ncbi:MAG: YbaB/EbfC family nucleoid-associated protein [candidate division Zixibacteria bacterium]|nr:YbaB/EbfC family nucleoid-associated protein [candidate division Zixibacteria bacterium]MCI0595864.1 YbaB/EbfC family nucleoid-associated protein [candidate division Zixibacteria bacterium]
MKGFGDIFKQAQQFQEKLERIQTELGETRVEGTAGGGMVRVIANGKQEIVELKIEREAVNPEEVEMLQDLILAALAQAREKAAASAQEKMAALTGGLKIPGLPGFGM